ncbi:MAG: M15 family metallopeptidase [Treponema sp.]|jgi:peptidoglycan L-alanyl-D-glutamate endopeptidase CwlK|nr:M15 family metallopeptidase [Treponema sp.]
MGKLDLLNSGVQRYFDDFVNKLEQRGLRYSIVETLRTQAVQEAYYAQGRESLERINELRKKAGLYLLEESEAKKVVTKTMNSIHLTGKAADIVPVLDGKVPWLITANNAELWRAFGALGQEAGLEWGGSWPPFDKFHIGWDAPHYQRNV